MPVRKRKIRKQPHTRLLTELRDSARLAESTEPAPAPAVEPEPATELETETESAPVAEPAPSDQISIGPVSLPVSTEQLLAEMVDAETEHFEATSRPTPTNTLADSLVGTDSDSDSSSGPSVVSVLDLADQINSSPQFRSAAINLAEQTLSRMLFDATEDNRVILTLNGQSIQQYKSDWTAYNTDRIDKIPFSTYLSIRLSICRQHSSDKSIYLRAEHVQQLDRLAEDNFQTADQLVGWITRAITPTAQIEGGEKMVFSPISSQVYERFASRCYPGETPGQLIDKVVKESLAKEVGLW